MERAELFTEMERSIVNYDKDEAIRLAQLALEKGVSPAEAINEGFLKGIQAVGDLFGEEDIFLPELIMAGDAMSAASAILGEHIKKSGGKVKYLAKGISGTVKGDIHDIGIKLVTTFLTANGFDMTFLGTDIPASVFVDKAKELEADLVLLSALLQTTMQYQKEVIDCLIESGIRKNVKVLVGGAVISQDWANEIGADGYGTDANAAAVVAMKLIGR